jgi:peptidoglycan/xylan/chitin deacetylase (PgdA/CDA1 family)
MTCDRPVMDGPALRRLHTAGFELGSHTRSHRVLTKLTEREALAEMTDGKRWLEDQIGAPVTSFCYPCGIYSPELMRLARDAGFTRARATSSLRWDSGDDRFAIPTTAQCYPHGRGVHLRHAVKEGNWRGLRQWLVAGLPATVEELLSHAIAQVVERGGVVHLWGHSWELEERGLWPLFESALACLVRRPGRVVAATNAVAYG